MIQAQHLTYAVATERDSETWNTPFHAALLKLEELLKQDKIENRKFEILFGYIDFFIAMDVPCYQMNLNGETVYDIYARLPEVIAKMGLKQKNCKTSF